MAKKELKQRSEFSDTRSYIEYLRNNQGYNRRGKEELTAEMHYEFLQNEIPHDDFMVYAVFGAIRRGINKEKACKQYGITQEFYDANIGRILNG